MATSPFNMGEKFYYNNATCINNEESYIIATCLTIIYWLYRKLILKRDTEVRLVPQGT